MITGTLFQTSAFPWLFINPNGGIVERGPGTLFRFPRHGDEQAAVAFCQRARGGVSLGPQGYAVYVREMPFIRGYRLALYGLKIKGVSTVQGKSGELSINLTKEQIQSYVEHFLAGTARASIVVGDLITSSVHEIRSINTDIKHASEEIIGQEYANEINITGLIWRARNINALSEILSRRTDFLEFVTDPQVTRIQRRRTRVYPKFDKVKRSLESRANQRKIKMRIEGSSTGSIDALIVFEVVPYLIVQNAVKYSPDGGDVVIEAAEDHRNITFSVCNWGPRLEKEEIEAVFEQGFRGRRAKEAGIKGSGFGLYFLRELVEVHHQGTIEFRQDGMARSCSGAEYSGTVVTIVLPRSDL